MWPRMSSWSAMLLLLAISFTGIEDSYAFSSCEPLKRLLVHADTGFRGLRGYDDPRIRGWVATYRLPGASLCTIEDVKSTAYYSCRWAHDLQSGSVSKVYSDLIVFVSRCLKVSATSHQSEGQDRQSVSFGIADTRKTIVVEKDESPSSERRVTLYVIPLDLKALSSE